jgi:hypothetical protein
MHVLIIPDAPPACICLLSNMLPPKTCQHCARWRCTSASRGPRPRQAVTRGLWTRTAASFEHHRAELYGQCPAIPGCGLGMPGNRPVAIWAMHGIARLSPGHARILPGCCPGIPGYCPVVVRACQAMPGCRLGNFMDCQDIARLLFGQSMGCPSLAWVLPGQPMGGARGADLEWTTSLGDLSLTFRRAMLNTHENGCVYNVRKGLTNETRSIVRRSVTAGSCTVM